MPKIFYPEFKNIHYLWLYKINCKLRIISDLIEILRIYKGLLNQTSYSLWYLLFLSGHLS